MQKSIILIGVFALLMAAPSFGQTQENTQATSTQKSENSAFLQKKEVNPQMKRAKLEEKTVEARTVKALEPTQNNTTKDVRKAEPIEQKNQKTLRKEN